MQCAIKATAFKISIFFSFINSTDPMKNQWFVIFLTLLISAICIFFLSFSFVTRSVEADAEAFATSAEGVVDYDKKQNYLDSMWTVESYNLLGASFTYGDLKEKELALGLDLQGGMHLTLEVSPVEILVALSGDSQNPQFREALKNTQAQQAQSQQRFTEDFFSEYEKIAGAGKLAEVFVNAANRDKIDYKSSDDDIKDFIRGEVNGAIDRAEQIIRTRIDKFGVTQPNIQRVQGTGRVQVELPGVNNPERVRKLLQGVAKLEFWEVYNAQEYIPFVQAANDFWVKKTKSESQLAELTPDAAQEGDSTATEEAAPEEQPTADEGDDLFLEDTPANGDFTALADADSAAQAAADSAQLAQQFSPLLTKMVRFQNGGADLVYAGTDTAEINKIITDPGVKTQMPKNVRFAWTVKPIVEDAGRSLYQLYVLKGNTGGKASLGGDVVVDATQQFDDRGRPDISMKMNVKGAKAWRKLTGENVGRQVAIVLDDYVYSAPVVQGEIAGGNSSISGSFTIDEAKDLANILKAGKLPAPTRIVEEAVVGPSLGVEAQNQGLLSIGVGLALVVVFMIAYYAKGGMVANVALLVNLFFIFGILANLNAALTLPGIAGIVLTIGMSIDANVLIFERIREEMESKGLILAIKDGYNRAFITIVDANLTTFLTAIFLYVFGLGPIKGFAITLMVGIACSFFTAVWVTRVIITWMTRKGEDSGVSFKSGLSRNLLKDMDVKFMAKRKMAYSISGAIIAVGLVLMFTTGLTLGVDFQGGRSYVVQFSEAVSPTEIKIAVDAKLGSSEVKAYDTDNKVKITTPYLTEDESSEADEKVLSAVMAGLDQFQNLKPEIVSSSKVGATIADDIQGASQIAVIFSLIVLFLYILVRFRGWEFGLGAVAALFHDTLFVLSMFAIANAAGVSFEIDQVFVAAMLTIIGYSINDTVVVFDRVREFLTERGGRSVEDTFNASISSTLSRTVITSVTTLLVVLILFIFGGEVLRGFSFALLIGVLVGTYSSIFIATPVVLDAAGKRLAKKLEVQKPAVETEEEAKA